MKLYYFTEQMQKKINANRMKTLGVFEKRTIA